MKTPNARECCTRWQSRTYTTLHARTERFFSRLTHCRVSDISEHLIDTQADRQYTCVVRAKNPLSLEFAQKDYHARMRKIVLLTPVSNVGGELSKMYLIGFEIGVRLAI